MKTSLLSSLSYISKGIKMNVKFSITLSLFNTSLKYNFVLYSCYVLFVFTFAYFIVIKNCLYFDFAHFMFLILGFMFVFWSFCFMF
jgi:hypothetical protein